MPSKPGRVCSRCSCGVVVDDVCNNGCKQKTRSAAEVDRPSSSARGYDATWQKFRLHYLYNHNPLCVDCLEEGRTSSAVELHHIERLKTNPARRLDPDNIVGLCKRCHSKRTARGE